MEFVINLKITTVISHNGSQYLTPWCRKQLSKRLKVTNEGQFNKF